MDGIDLKPTQEMAENAARGLALREKHKRGGTEVGVARARDLQNRKNLSPETVRRMDSFFARHAGNEAGGEDDAGYIAWLLWGGDAGRDWAGRKVKEMDGDDGKVRNSMPDVAELERNIAKWNNMAKLIKPTKGYETATITRRMNKGEKEDQRWFTSLLDAVKSGDRAKTKSVLALGNQDGSLRHHVVPASVRRWANESQHSKMDNARTPSHQVTPGDGAVTIHDLEVFCAYDPRIDGDSDEELSQFDNERVRSIVEGTLKYMAKGSMPRLVVMHERDGQEPKSSVGRFTKLRYEERDGVGYIVGDCEVERSVFEKLLATNAFPRRSAEIWPEQNHLSEVALLGRETPRRPLPDTHFTRAGQAVRFARSLRFDMGTVGGGLSTYVPTDKDTHMADDLHKEVAALKAAMDEMKDAMKRAFAADEAKDGDKEEMAADEMLTQQFAAEDEKKEDFAEDAVHIDIGSHTGAPDEDEDEVEVEMGMAGDERLLAGRPGRADVFALKRENAKMARQLAEMKAEMAREKFSRELDAMEADGYRIPASHRPRLLGELSASRNPADLLEAWRDLFARDPMGVRIDMSRAAVPAGDIDAPTVSELVRQFAGKPEEYRKAINARKTGK